MASGIGKLIKVSDRGQVSLGSLAQYDLYLGTLEEDGTIVLRPASVVPIKRKVSNEQH